MNLTTMRMDTHPPFEERIQDMAKWKDDPRLKMGLTEELIMEVGGPDFQEAVSIYRQYGR